MLSSTSIYRHGVGSEVLTSGNPFSWSELMKAYDCDNCATRDGCDGTCTKPNALDAAEVRRDG